MEKRCEVYTRTAGLVLEIEDALDAEDAEQARLLVEDVRRALRSALAFLTEEVVDGLEHVETLAQALAQASLERATSDIEDLRDALTLLHVKLARSLRLPAPDLAELVSLTPRLRRKLEESRRAFEEKQRRRAVEEKTWDYEAVARELIGARQYKRAVKQLKQALRLDPERAVFHNDLGVVYGLLGLHEEAANEYRIAVSLNEKNPDRRTDEWTTSYYNLGVALRKLAHEHDAPGQETRALGIVREAKGAFEEYLKVTPGGPKIGFARSVAKQLSEDALILETRARAAESNASRSERPLFDE
jgi:tetratricopeptide (TPR) repeat protein